MNDRLSLGSFLVLALFRQLLIEYWEERPRNPLAGRDDLLLSYVPVRAEEISGPDLVSDKSKPRWVFRIQKHSLEISSIH